MNSSDSCATCVWYETPRWDDVMQRGWCMMVKEDTSPDGRPCYWYDRRNDDAENRER